MSMNKMLSDEELENIVGGTRDECLEIMQWCNDHGSVHISLPADGQKLDPAELWKAYNFILDKLHSLNYKNMNLKMPNEFDNLYTLYDPKLGKKVTLSHSEFMNLLNENF